MTMDNAQGNQNKTQSQIDATLKGNEPSSVSQKPSPKETPKSYTQSELEGKLQEARMEAGRKWKADLEAVTKERDSYKSQLATVTSELEVNRKDITELQEKIDDMASNDPARFDAVKELKAAKEERKQLQAKERALETEKQTHAERIKKAEDVEREVLILQITEDYEGADADKLTTLCTSLNVKSDEHIRKIADTLWTKKATEDATSQTPPLPYSGVTDGGAEDLNALSPREQILKAYSKKK